jgi:uncharacterized radical SAM superfamily protein
MKSTEQLHINGIDMFKNGMEEITFKQFVEEILNVPFEEVYKDNLKEALENYGQESNLE